MERMGRYEKWRIVENDREVTVEPISASEVELYGDEEIPINALNALELTAEKVDLEEKIIYCRRY
jgi:hypothetical protein